MSFVSLASFLERGHNRSRALASRRRVSQDRRHERAGERRHALPYIHMAERAPPRFHIRRVVAPYSPSSQQATPPQTRYPPGARHACLTMPGPAPVSCTLQRRDRFSCGGRALGSQPRHSLSRRRLLAFFRRNEETIACYGA